DRLREVLVEPEAARDRARDLRHLEAVREARPVVVAGLGNEDLGLPDQPPERRRMDDAVAVALEQGAQVVRGLLMAPAARVAALHPEGRERRPLGILEILPAPNEARRTHAGQRTFGRGPAQAAGARERLRQPSTHAPPAAVRASAKVSAPFADP